MEGEEGGREASGVAENPGEGRHRVAGGQVVSGQLNPQRSGRRSRAVSGRLDRLKGRGTQGRQKPGSPHIVLIPTGEDGQGGGGDKNPPTARATRGKGPNGRDGTTQSRRTAEPNEAMEMAEGDGGAGHLTEHFNGADGAITENGKHPR